MPLKQTLTTSARTPRLAPSRPVIKYYFKGQVEYEGKNKVVKDAWRANLTWSGGNYYFADTQPGRYTVDLLNKCVMGCTMADGGDGGGSGRRCCCRVGPGGVALRRGEVQ